MIEARRAFSNRLVLSTIANAGSHGGETAARSRMIASAASEPGDTMSDATSISPLRGGERELILFSTEAFSSYEKMLGPGVAGEIIAGDVDAEPPNVE